MTPAEMDRALATLGWSVRDQLSRHLGCDRRTAARLVLADPAVGAWLMARAEAYRKATEAIDRHHPAPNWRKSLVDRPQRDSGMHVTGASA